METIEEAFIDYFAHYLQTVHEIIAEKYPQETIDVYIEKYIISNYDFDNDMDIFNRDIDSCNIKSEKYYEDRFFKEAYYVIYQFRKLLSEYEKQTPNKLTINKAIKMAKDWCYIKSGLCFIMSEYDKKNECEFVGDFAECFGEIKALKEASKKATDKLHKGLREFKLRASEVAKKEWDNGSTLLHHQMAKYLAEQYEDENSKHPFMFLPESENSKKLNNSKESPDNVLRQVCKKVAKEINRPGLISGLGKIKS